MFVRAARSTRRNVLSGGCALAGRSCKERGFAETREATAAEVGPVISSKTAQRLAIATLGGLGVTALYWGLTDRFSQLDDRTTFVNWSHTHEVTPW